MLPPRERLHARHVATGEIHDRPVAQRELPIIHCALEIGLSLAGKTTSLSIRGHKLRAAARAWVAVLAVAQPPFD
jgi:hypothetical protein